MKNEDMNRAEETTLTSFWPVEERTEGDEEIWANRQARSSSVLQCFFDRPQKGVGVFL
jgi:hypothetical protein